MTTRSDSQSMTAAYAAVPGERRSERLDLRVTPTEASFIRQAAASRRQSVTEFLTAAAMNEVFDRLVDEMDGPEEVVPALANLIRRPRRLKLPE